MFFEYPRLLWLLALPLLLVAHYLYLELRQRHPRMRVSSSAPWLSGGRSPLAVLVHLLLFRGGKNRHRGH